MKKLNWGVMIAIFYSAFVLVLIAFLFYSRTVKFDLVSEDYYDQEIKYQDRIDKIIRAKSLKQQLELETFKEAIMLQYPSYMNRSELTGKIHFYRPSDKNLDFFITVAVDSSNKQIVPTSNLKSGLWNLKVEWAKSDSTFYNEFAIVLN